MSIDLVAVKRLRDNTDVNEEELIQRRNELEELSRRVSLGEITQEYYDDAFDTHYEFEKKFGLLKPGSWFWDSILDELNAQNPNSTKE